MTTLEANPDAKAHQETAESVYADQAQFESALDDAAEHLSRGHWRRREREILAVGGVLLIVFTILKIVILQFPELSGRFIPGPWLAWGWIIGTVWSAVYLVRLRRLRSRILEKRLCLCCGFSLLNTPLGNDGIGFCPECGTVFSLGEYAPPIRCVTALRRARQRMLEMCPSAPDLWPALPQWILPDETFFLYRDARHFDRVMRKATRRIMDENAKTLNISAFSLIPWLIVMAIVGLWLAGPQFALIIPGIALAGFAAIFYDYVRFSSFRARLLGARRCLGCGYVLEHLTLNDLGGGICPECGRPFHLKEYVSPPPGWHEENWQHRRAMVIPRRQ